MNILTRVEEEKAINRALSGIPLPTNVDSNRQKSPPPAPVSRFRRENHLFLPEHIKWWHSAQNTKVFGQAGRQLPESPGRHQWSNSSSSPFLPLSPSVISPSGRPGWVGGGVFECPLSLFPSFSFCAAKLSPFMATYKSLVLGQQLLSAAPFHANVSPRLSPQLHTMMNCLLRIVAHDRQWCVRCVDVTLTVKKNFTPDNLKTWSCNTDCLPRWKWFILNFKVPENELSDSDLRMH